MTTVPVDSTSGHAAGYRFERFHARLLLKDMKYAQSALRPGDRVPDLEAFDIEGERVRLLSWADGRPLLIITGSITCPMTASSLPGLAKLHERYGERVAFVLLYTREAHPGERYPQPHELDLKISHAKNLRSRYDVPWPVLIDDVDGTIHRALDAKPNSVHLLAPDGTIGFRALWAGDIPALTDAVAAMAVAEPLKKKQTNRMMVPVIKAGGYIDEVIELAGPSASRDMRWAAPPMAVLGRIAGWVGVFPKHQRGFGALLMMALLVLLAFMLSSCSSISQSIDSAFLKPVKREVVTPAEFGLAFEAPRIEVEDGVSLQAWFLPAERAEGRTVVLFHGSSANISYYFPYYRFLHGAGFNVFLYDYRGYGRSDGDASFASLFGDLGAVFGFLEGHESVALERTVVYGISMGTILALEAASEYPQLAGVVVEDCVSPDDNVAAYLTRQKYGAVSRFFATALLDTFILPWGIEPTDNVDDLAMPSLLIHGENDYKLDLRTSVRAHRASGGSGTLWILPDTGHAPHSLHVHDGTYQAGVIEFLRGCCDRSWRPIGVRWNALEARDGITRGSVSLSQRGTVARVPVEISIMNEKTQFVFRRVWLGERSQQFEIEVPGEIVGVGAKRYLHVEDQGRTWSLPPSAFIRDKARHAEISARMKALGGEPGAKDLLAVGAEIEAMARVEAFTPWLEAELTQVYYFLGSRLRRLPGHDDAARRWLWHTVDAIPERPELHVRTGRFNYALGYSSASLARRAGEWLLQDLGQSTGDGSEVMRVRAKLARLPGGS